MSGGPIRLLALDLDGTILTSDLHLSPRTRAAVAAALAVGVHVTIATGRMYRSTLRYAFDLQLPGPLICYQGGYIRDMPAVDGRPGELLLHRTMPAQAALAAIVWSRANGLDPHVNAGDRLVIERGPQAAADYERMAGIGAELVSDIAAAVDMPVTKVLAVGPPGLPDRLLVAGRAAFIGELEVTVSHPEYLEFMPLGVTKASGVAFVAERLGISMAETMAIGDQANDIEMLREVGLGVAMGDAPAAVRAAADVVTSALDRDGAAMAIERQVLGGRAP